MGVDISIFFMARDLNSIVLSFKKKFSGDGKK